MYYISDSNHNPRLEGAFFLSTELPSLKHDTFEIIIMQFVILFSSINLSINFLKIHVFFIFLRIYIYPLMDGTDYPALITATNNKIVKYIVNFEPMVLLSILCRWSK